MSALKLKMKKLSVKKAGEVEDFDEESVAYDEMVESIKARVKVAAEEAKLKARLAELAKTKKDMETKVRKFASLMEDKGVYDPYDKYTLYGDGSLVEIGKRAQVRSVTDEGKEALVDMLSEVDFFKLVQFKLGDLDAYLTPEQLQKVLKIEPGDRSISLKIVHDEGDDDEGDDDE